MTLTLTSSVEISSLWVHRSDRSWQGKNHLRPGMDGAVSGILKTEAHEAPSRTIAPSGLVVVSSRKDEMWVWTGYFDPDKLFPRPSSAKGSSDSNSYFGNRSAEARAAGIVVRRKPEKVTLHVHLHKKEGLRFQQRMLILQVQIQKKESFNRLDFVSGNK